MRQMRLEPGWARSKPPNQPIELQLIDCLGYLHRSPLDFAFEAECEENRQDDADEAKKFIQRMQQIHKVVQE